MNPNVRERLRHAAALLVAVLALGFLTGCATNPVTGNRELQLVSEGHEIVLGQQSYVPAQQAEGGPFNAEPTVTDYVEQVGKRLVAVAHRPELPYEFIVLNNGVPNAWALPGGKIAINRGLLVELSSEAELAAVLAHEIVHAAARHGAKSVERGMLMQAGMAAVAIAAADHEDGEWAVGGAALGLTLTRQKYSRNAEREADHYSVGYLQAAGYDPRAAIDLQQAFVRMQEGKRSGFIDGLFASHPPSQERVEHLKALCADLPPGGRRGSAEYEQAIAPLMNGIGAYRALDEAQKALAKKNVPHALRLAQAASRKIPEEALAHGTLGDALVARGDYLQAIKAYDRAIQRQGEYFRYHLMRGLALKDVGRVSEGRASLERSVALLPTSAAHYQLGLMDRSLGHAQAAISHFRVAAGAQDKSGTQARTELARLVLPQAPAEYLQTRLSLDGSSQLVIRIHNGSPVAVRNVMLDVRVNGQRFTARYAQRLEAGRTVDVPTGFGPYPADGQGGPQASVSIRSAQLAE